MTTMNKILDIIFMNKFYAWNVTRLLPVSGGGADENDARLARQLEL
jgi:hypothetical protein